MGKNLSHTLPGRITSILPQKNNRERYSVFIEEGFLIGVSESVLLEYNLSKGAEITPLLFKKLQKAEGRQAVKFYCLRMLSRRDHSRKELLDKAAKKGYPRDIIGHVLNELEEKNYLDDRLFAKKFATDKSRLNHWGPAKIKSHLYKRGIPRHLAEAGIESAFEDLDLRNVFIDLVRRKQRRFLREKDFYRRKKKMFDYLKRKGYRSENITNYLDELAELIST